MLPQNTAMMVWASWTSIMIRLHLHAAGGWNSQQLGNNRLKTFSYSDFRKEYAEKFVVEEDREQFLKDSELSNMQLQLQNQTLEFITRVRKSEDSIRVMKTKIRCTTGRRASVY